MKVKKGGGDSEDNFLWEMSERHGGEPWFPLWRAERSELMQNFCDERTLAL